MTNSYDYSVMLNTYTEKAMEIFGQSHQFEMSMEDDFNRDGVRKNVQEWLDNKAHLMGQFRKHPQWNEDELSIILDEEIIRPSNLAYFIGQLENIIANHYGSYLYSPLYSELMDCLEHKSCPYVFKKDDLEKYPALACLEFKDGQKVSRAMNAYFVKMGADKHPEYNKLFAKMADAISPITYHRKIIISLNFCDYLLMSYGNSWDSCHKLDGCYRVGSLSYANDDSTAIVYTLDDTPYKFDYYREPKINRQVFSFDHTLNFIFQSRLYPDDHNTELHKKLREVVQMVTSEITGEANLWETKHDSHRDIYTHDDAQHYQDYTNGFKHCSSYRQGYSYDAIDIGAPAYALDNENHMLTVEDCFNNCACSNCDSSISDRDDRLYINDELYCRDCATYCEHCHEYHPNDCIEHIDDMWVCDDCRGRHYFECEECGGLHRNDNAFWIDDEEIDVCESCYFEHFYRCDNCDRTFRSTNIISDGYDHYCQSCYEEMEAKEVDETEEVPDMVYV